MTRVLRPIVRGGAVAAAFALALGCVPPADGGSPRIGAPAAAYEAATLDGRVVSLESLRGQAVLLNLWATWCIPCRQETPYLESVYNEYKDQGFEIVGISMDAGEAADDVAMFVEDFGVTYTILHDPQMSGMELYQVLGLPATFLIDREGVLRWMRYGPIPEGDGEFLAALRDVLS
jgi:peroxiredoxin